MNEIKRRDFISKGTVAALSAPIILNSACTSDTSQQKNQGPYINFNEKFRWKMATTWPPNFPILGEGCNMFAQWVKEMSGGRMEIIVYGGGELVPALEIFDAVSNSAIELGHGAAYYWAGKIPSAQFFATVPFGMNAQQMNAWLLSGGGLELWKEIYSNFNLLPFPGGNMGMQMGGWFNKEINTAADIKGLKMRIPGIGGKVFTRAGGSAVLSAGSEIYTNLERGVIDAAEWIGPYHDYLMGFHNIATYYYYPGWQEPGTALELIISKTKFESLPSDLQTIISTATERLNMWMLAVSEMMNSLYTKKLAEEEQVQLKKFPDEVLAILKKYSDEVVDEIITNDPPSKKAYDSYHKFHKQMAHYAQYTEKIYHSDFGIYI